MKNIVIIGGGTGTFTLLSGLRKFPTNNSVIVSSADDGGSTGKLRKDLGVFPPGDLRQCLVGLSYTEEHLKQLFNYRFEKGDLAGHTAGNIILAAMEKIMGGIEPALKLASRLLNVRGQVIPVTFKPTHLTAILQNGKKIVGEHNIDDRSPKDAFVKIKSLKLTPSIKVNPAAQKAIIDADVIVLGPGDLYTSILPNFLPKGAIEAVNKSKAKKALVVSLMTKHGQTNKFKASNFVRIVRSYIKNLDVAIVNTQKPKNDQVRKYLKERAEFVEADIKTIKEMKVEVISSDLVSARVEKASAGDKLKRSALRHDSDKLAKIIYEL